MLKKLPSKYFSIIFPVIMSILMSSIMSLSVTLINLGFSIKSLYAWPLAFIKVFPISLPLTFCISIIARKLTLLIVKRSEPSK